MSLIMEISFIKAKRKCPDTLRVWEATGQPKITVKCDTEEEMMLLLAKARSLGLVRNKYN